MYKRLMDTLPESRKLGRISDFAHRCWTAGLSKADWFGRLTAEPDKFRLVCFPNRPQVTEDEIKSALDELADAGKSGLIHLYQTDDGERFMVFHNHDEHNPSGGWTTKPKRYPPPQTGLCRCVKYSQKESPKSIGGKQFRFFTGLFCTDQSLVSAKVTDQSLGMLLSSPISSLSSSSGEFGKLCDEFTHLTGRPPLAGIGDPGEFEERLKGLLQVRGLTAMLAVLGRKTSECVQRTGRPPNSLQYFVPIFEDDRVFNGDANGRRNGALNPGAKEVVGHFALRDGDLDQRLRERIAERERREAAVEGDLSAQGPRNGAAAP